MWSWESFVKLYAPAWLTKVFLWVISLCICCQIFPDVWINNKFLCRRLGTYSHGLISQWFVSKCAVNCFLQRMLEKRWYLVSVSMWMLLYNFSGEGEFPYGRSHTRGHRPDVFSIFHPYVASQSTYTVPADRPDSTIVPEAEHNSWETLKCHQLPGLDSTKTQSNCKRWIRIEL